MSDFALHLFAISIGALATTALFWVFAQRAAVVRGINLGPVPYLRLLLGATSAVVLSPFDAVAAIATCAVCVAALCDARTGFIFDPIICGGLGAVGALAFWTGDFRETFSGATVVAGTLLGLWAITRRRGLGLGDVKLGAVIGAGIGPSLGIVALGAAFVLGAASGIGQIAAGRARRDTAVRFGPYLAAGTLVVLAYHHFSTGVIR